MTSDLDKIPLPLLILVLVLLISQSVFLFQDARRRNLHPWFWGIYGIIQAPMPTILYFIIERKIFKNIRKKRSENSG